MSTAVQEKTEPIVAISEAAVRQLKRQMARTGNEGKAVRLGVRGGGCSGLSYAIAYEDPAEIEEDENVWTLDDLTVVVDPRSARFLEGATLDYSVRNLMEGGFVFDNPNAARSCGCGTSFTAK